MRAVYRSNYTLADLDAMMDRAVNGEPSHSGVDVSPATAMNYSAVFNAVYIIANSLASLPLRLYQRTSESGKQQYRAHPLFDLLHNLPNPEMTSYVFRETLQGHVLLWGNAYAEIIKSTSGKPLALWPLNPAGVEVSRDKANKLEYKLQETQNENRIIPAERMLHIPGLGFDGRVGYSVLQKAREAFGLGLAMEEFQSRFYGQGTNVGAVLEHPGKLSKEAHDRLSDDINKKRGGLAESHKTLILEEGLKLNKTGMPLDDAQFLESRVFQIGEIARWFNLPPHKLKELSKATYSNIEQQQIEYVQDTIRPWAVRWEQHMDWKLLAPEERKTLFIEFNLDGLLRGDTKSRMEAYAILRNIGTVNADEIREKENMNPIGGRAGSLYWQPANMVDASVENTPVVESVPETDTPSEEEENNLRVLP